MSEGDGGVAVVREGDAGPQKLFTEPEAESPAPVSGSPASNSSTTPQTDNRVPEDESNVALPESTKQPVLETIGSPPVVTNTGRPSVDPRQVRSPSNRRRRRKKALSDLGPMVVSNEQGASARDTNPTSVDMKGRSSYGRSRRNHRRTSSEEFIPTEEDVMYMQTRGGAVPPQQMLPSARQQELYMQQQHQQQGMRQTISPPAHVRQSRRRGHQRVRSLPSGPHPFWDGQAPPPPGFSPAGNPLIPILNQDGLPMEGYAPEGASRHKRKQQYSSNRARSSSASGAVQMYGPVPEQGEYSPTGPPPITPEKTPGSHHFSPRGEIMSLAKTFSPQKGMRAAPASPVPVLGVAPGSPIISRGVAPASPIMGRMTPPLSPAQGGSFRGMSPQMSPPQSSLRRGGSYGAAAEENTSVRGVSFSPGTPINTRQMAMYAADEPGVPEDLIQSAKRAGKHKRSAHSLRKMNMRQQSAQLFMEDSKGVIQPKACRDVLFAILFVVHLAGMVYLGMTYGWIAIKTPSTPDQQDDDDSTPQVKLAYQNVIYVACLCGAFAVALSALVLWLMIMFARRVVQVALILTIGLSFAWGTIGIGLSPKNIVPITGIIALALSVGYTFVVWDRIPFATANLMAALSAIRENIGTVLISFCFQGFALMWSIYFTFVVVGVYDALLTGDLVLGHRAVGFVYAMLGISYYWTFHVLLNVVQVAVAGTIGVWWFEHRAHVCDGAVARNLFYALTLSFGSICFGSLLVGPVRLIRQLSIFFRPSQDEESVLMCLHECLSCIQNCIASCTDNLAAYFNPWAFTYVGLYGYGFLDAGHNATTLFEKRGWTKIVADDLIPNILLMVSLVIGGVTGCFGFLIESVEGLNFNNEEKEAGAGATAKAFAIGLAVGLVLTSVLFGIISSSVNAVLVCFAGSPVEFERYHPELSQEMRSAWREVWPGCMSVVDIKVAYSTGSFEPDESTPLV